MDKYLLNFNSRNNRVLLLDFFFFFLSLTLKKFFALRIEYIKHKYLQN